MPYVNTVLGPVDSSNLGATLTHEHITCSSAGVSITYPELLDKTALIEIAVEDLSKAREAGIKTFVDITTMDLGRDVRLQAEVSRRTGVHIICATGSWLDTPRSLWDKSPETIASLWTREIQDGIEGTKIKPGVIKVATSETISEVEELMLRSAAKTQLQTGVPISTHTPPLSRVGIDQLNILQEEGADLKRVYIGHVNSTLENDYLTGMMDYGVTLGMDHFFPGGPPGTPAWEERALVIRELISSGYQDRIMLSHDWNVGATSTPCWYLSREDNPDGWTMVSLKVLPRLKELGATEDDINQIMVNNPRRFFGIR